MRRIDLMLIIVAIIFLTAGCAEKSTYQNSYYGEWVASDKLYYMPISAMSEDYYKEISMEKQLSIRSAKQVLLEKL